MKYSTLNQEKNNINSNKILIKEKSIKPKNIIEIKSLDFSYGNDKIFENISINIEDGDFVAIIGPNGAGKSTLIKILLGILKPNKGEIKIFNKDIEKNSKENLIGYVPQILSFEKNFPASVKEILEIKGEINEKILNSLQIKDLLNKQFINLSGGQKQRVLIAFTLMSSPKLLILDEPTTGIDPKSQQNFYQLLKKINNEENITILLVTHDVGIIPSVAKKVLCINHNICCMGHSKDINELLKQVYEENYIVHHHTHHHHDIAGEKCCNHKH